jgi:hypothetical protein
VLPQPIAADWLAGAAPAIRPGPDIGLAAIEVDGGEDVDTRNLHHVVHEDVPMKISEVWP